MADTIAKPDLTPDERDSKIFYVAKYVADQLYCSRKCYIQSSAENIIKELGKAGMHDEKLLVELLNERANKHNGTIDAALTKIKSIRFERWWSSALFKGIGLDTEKVKKLVAANQHWEVWDIYKLYFDCDHKPRT